MEYLQLTYEATKILVYAEVPVSSSSLLLLAPQLLVIVGTRTWKNRILSAYYADNRRLLYQNNKTTILTKTQTQGIDRSSLWMPLFDSPLFVHAMTILLDDENNDIEDCDTASNISHLLECFVDALTPMEDACVNDLQTAVDEMNQMNTLAPQLARFPELLLEQTTVCSVLMAMQ